MLDQLKKECREELIHDILPFWKDKMLDTKQGGFYGQIDGHGCLHPGADKGGILNARILWTFSAAYRTLSDATYLDTANRSYGYIVRHFFDNEQGGTYWLLHADGTPADLKKQIYSQAFFIYALSEYHRATGNQDALQKAKELFLLIEEKSFDQVNNGYFEAYSRDWQLLDDLRLSEKDDNDAKTMNTHLHILEAYTNLYRVWNDKRVESALRNLILLFLEKFISSSGHLILFFDEKWKPNDHIHSYGHDIESAWLMYEAAVVLGDESLLLKVKEQSLKIAEVTMNEGVQPDGSLIYEKDTLTNHIDTDRHWWPQAEAVVGFLYTWKITGDDFWLNRSMKTWQYIKNNLIDTLHGEWYWSIQNGMPNLKEDKAGFWKCPYHNSRMCYEVIEIK